MPGAKLAHMLPGEFHLKVECVTKMKAVLQTELYEDSYEIDQRVPTGRVIIQIGKWVVNNLSRSIISAPSPITKNVIFAKDGH